MFYFCSRDCENKAVLHKLKKTPSSVLSRVGRYILPMALQCNIITTKVTLRFRQRSILAFKRFGYASLQPDEHRSGTCIFIYFTVRKPSMICTNPRVQQYVTELSSFIPHGKLMRPRTVQSQTEMEHMLSRQNCATTTTPRHLTCITYAYKT